MGRCGTVIVLSGSPHFVNAEAIQMDLYSIDYLGWNPIFIGCINVYFSLSDNWALSGPRVYFSPVTRSTVLSDTRPDQSHPCPVSLAFHHAEWLMSLPSD
jgi:hypothetical protein